MSEWNAIIRRTLRVGCAVLTILAVGGSTTADERKSVAAFDLEFVDTSGEGDDPAQNQRLKQTSTKLRELLAANGQFVIVDIAPATEQIEAAGYLRSCNGCDIDIARDLGADLALIGTVTKVSSLIIYISVVMTDAHTGEAVRIRTDRRAAQGHSGRARPSFRRRIWRRSSRLPPPSPQRPAAEMQRRNSDSPKDG